ncbi:hypothetical protein A0U91_16285 (plasmid) [Acetobacter persici]|uniref:Uncharacterized protein n=1 Tax=Acetobacter persici TaxID=1076596 RepID=A0A1U9LJD2_9PROT|nr:hypothetical protein A0U91_16285 [Acetobacter persici]
MQGLAGNVIKGIEEFCRSVHLDWDIPEKPTSRPPTVADWVMERPLKDLHIYLSAPNRTLVPDARDKESTRLIREIPDQVYFVGPLVYLDMQGGQEASDIATEVFRFLGDSGAGRGADALREACDALLGVALDAKFKTEFDKETLYYAKVCRNCLKRDSFQITGQQFRTQKKINSKGLWVVMPSDWTSFLRVVEHEGDTRSDVLRRASEWQSILHIAVSGQQGPQWHTPFEPYYEHQPFMAASLSTPPTGLERAFDNRYLASTSEFNLLNLILCRG